MDKSDKEKNKNLSALSKRKALPGLPNLEVTVGESPTLAREISRIRIQRANVSKFFWDVLEDGENG